MCNGFGVRSYANTMMTMATRKTLECREGKTIRKNIRFFKNLIFCVCGEWALYSLCESINKAEEWCGVLRIVATVVKCSKIGRVRQYQEYTGKRQLTKLWERNWLKNKPK